ncbi:MAG TPA: hypothetical protein VF307_00125, partial [Candidatus Nanopelagicaceae bacterium]
ARHLYLDDNHLSGEGPNEVATRYREFFNNGITVYTRKEAIEANLFGEVVTEPSFDRMGDVIAVPHDEIVLIDPLRADLESSMVGHHGAMTDAERLVPFRSVVLH